MWGIKWKIENRKSIQDLEIDYIPLKRSLLDMIPTMISKGYLPNKID